MRKLHSNLDCLLTIGLDRVQLFLLVVRCVVLNYAVSVNGPDKEKKKPREKHGNNGRKKKKEKKRTRMFSHVSCRQRLYAIRELTNGTKHLKHRTTKGYWFQEYADGMYEAIGP